MWVSNKKHLKMNTLNSEFWPLFQNLFYLNPHFMGNIQSNIGKAAKVLKTSWNRYITITIFKLFPFGGDIHMNSTLKGEGLGDKAKRRCYRTNGVGAVVSSKCSRRPVFIFLLNKIGFALWPDPMLSQIWIYHWQEIFL